MTLKAFLSRHISRLITSPRMAAWRRARASLPRRLKGGPVTICYFHQADDPYAHLAVQAARELAARYRIRLVPHLVPPPDDGAAPERARLEEWSRRDAAALAQRHGLAFPADAAAPDQTLVARANAAFAAALDSPDFFDRAIRIGTALWAHDAAMLASFPSASASDTSARMMQGAAVRKKYGHYLGATFFFEAEWYWGVDRLHYLETRLKKMRREKTPGTSYIVPPIDITCSKRPTNGAKPALDFFLSFRSPYTAIAVQRVRRLATHYGAELRLRFVLPMVMRGLPIPPLKRRYIPLDTKREADRCGAPFGMVVDPVGKPTERGLAVLHHAIAEGKGEAFAESFLTGVFAHGIDAGSDAGLGFIAQRAGVSAETVKRALADDSWRKVAEANRTEMFARGIWGVPSFRVNDGPVIWGQDRLWQIEDQLIAATDAK